MGVYFFAVLLFYIGITKSTKVDGHSVILTNSAISSVDMFDLNANGCECIRYNCGCCKYIKLDSIYINGTLCINASYLENSYGISVTMTLNNFTIINETVSARDPPPICIGEDIVDFIEVAICLHIYDIDVKSDEFHACFEIMGELMKIKTPTIKLGCIDTKLKEKKYVEDKFSYLLQLLRKGKSNDSTPSVIMI